MRGCYEPFFRPSLNVHHLEREFGSQLHKSGRGSADYLPEISAADISLDRCRAVELAMIEDVKCREPNWDESELKF